MSDGHFEVAYDGPDVRDGTMEVFDIAPALLGMGRLIRRANTILNGDSATVEVRVMPGRKHGSHLTDMLTIQHMGGQAHVLALSAPVLLKLLGFTDEWGGHAQNVNSLLDLFKRLRGQKPALPEEALVPNPPPPPTVQTLTDQTDAGGITVKVVINGNNNYVDSRVLELARDPQIQQYTREMLEPLTKKGVDTFEPRDGERVLGRIEKDDALAILSAATESKKYDLDHGVSVQWALATPQWDEKKAWRFVPHFGDPFTAKIDDPDFWTRVHIDHEKFSEHTELQVRVEWWDEVVKDKKIRRHIVRKVLQTRLNSDLQEDWLKRIKESASDDGGSDEATEG